MSDLICRKTMQRCPTESMCAPYCGCRETTTQRDILETIESALRHEGFTACVGYENDYAHGYSDGIKFALETILNIVNKFQERDG